MTELASQTVSAYEFDNGDSLTFAFDIDLPPVTLTDKSDLQVEVFGMNREKGKSNERIYL